MKAITNDIELRIAYMMLNATNGAVTVSPEQAEKIIEIKRAVRAYRDKPRTQARVIIGNFDELCTVEPLPKRLETAEEADVYFKQNHYIGMRPSIYDCTGRAFTRWYKIFKRQGQFWAYHSVVCDV